MMSIPGYTLLGAIKSTGPNTLFHAVRETDGLRGIIKIPMRAPSWRERERYRQEFTLLQRLEGVRGVPRALACEQFLDRPVLFLEAVEGTPLSALVGQPFALPRFLELAISLTSALADLHHHGVIHKDLGPSNILITPAAANKPEELQEGSGLRHRSCSPPRPHPTCGPSRDATRSRHPGSSSRRPA